MDVWGHACHSLCMEVRGKLEEVCSVLPLCMFKAWNSDLQSWTQASFLMEVSGLCLGFVFSKFCF